jgi:hypothetical protein
MMIGKVIGGKRRRNLMTQGMSPKTRFGFKTSPSLVDGDDDE